MAKTTEEAGTAIAAPIDPRSELVLASSVEVSSIAPSFMAGETEMGQADDLSQYVIPPRVKVIQKSRTQQYAAYVNGETILTPQGISVAKPGEKFWFVPVLFFPEWITVNPMSMKGSLPMIADRSMDPNCDIARKAKDPNLRGADLCPGATHQTDKYLRHQECLNFIVLLLRKPELAGMQVLLSFRSTGHKHGSNLCSLITMRRQEKIPMYGCVFEAVVPEAPEPNPNGEIWNIRVTNPSVGLTPPAPLPCVQNALEYTAIRDMHFRLLKSLKAGLVKADLETDRELDQTAEEGGSEKFA